MESVITEMTLANYFAKYMIEIKRSTLHKYLSRKQRKYLDSQIRSQSHLWVNPTYPSDKNTIEM